MQIPRLQYRIVLLIMLLSSCSGEKTSAPGKKGSAAHEKTRYFYETVKATEGTREKITYLDSALASIEDPNDTLLPLLIDYKIYYHNSLKEYDTSFYYADSLIRLSAVHKDTANLAKGYYRKARIYNYLGEQEEVFRNSFEARRFYAAAGDNSQAGRRTLEMALVQIAEGDQLGSQETATEALKLLEPEKDSVYFSSVHNIIAQVYHERELYIDAVTEYQNALKFAPSLTDSLSILNNLALVYRDNKDFEKAIAIWEELLSKADSDSRIARYRDNMAFTRWLQDPDVDVEKELLTALQLRQDINDETGLQASYGHLSEFYKKKDVQLFRKYSEELLNITREQHNARMELTALEKLIPVSPLPQTRTYSERYMQLSDSLQTAYINSKNFFAKIRYDEERKEQEIKSLEAENQIQQLEAQRIRTRTLTGALIALLLLLALSFLIYYLRQRHKREKIREVHKTENRISKVIHDELANDIYNVMSSLESVAPAPVVDKLEKIYLRTRDISRENSEIDTGENYIDYLKAALTNITSRNSRLIISGETRVNWARLQEEKKIVIYRVLQELLVNMKKHSGAKLVAISFAENKKYIEINYSDNGRGLNWKSLRKGSGLQNVENRLSSLNGKVEFESSEGKGFGVKILIPS